MSFLETIKSNGFAAFIIILILVDLLALFLVKGFESWAYLVVFQIVGAAVYVVSRALGNANDEFILWKKKK